MLILWNTKTLGITQFRETKFENVQEAKQRCRGMKGKVIVASLHPDGRKNGVVSWVPKGSPIYDMIAKVEVAGDGRWAIMRVSSTLESLGRFFIKYVCHHGVT